MSYKLLKVPPLEGFHPPPETSKTDPYLQVTTSSNPVISIQVTSAPSSSALKSEVVSSTASLGNRLNLDRPRLEPESYGIEKPLSYRLLPEILMPPPPVPRYRVDNNIKSKTTSLKQVMGRREVLRLGLLKIFTHNNLKSLYFVGCLL